MQSASPFLRQKSFNKASQFRWREFAAHRDRIASYLCAAAPSGSLCVLGAGNCNDQDLARLVSHYATVLLVDVDVEAMQAGVMHQLQCVPESIEFAACDLTGALEHCHEIASAPSREAFAKLRRALAGLPAASHIQRRFDVVASTCVLSQLIDLVRHVVGPEHPELPALASLVRMQHLRTLAELTEPGGTLLLFADFVSSDTLPELLTAPDEALPGLMEKALAHNNCFTGMNPDEIRRAIASFCEPVNPELWRWNLGPRTYLVAAISGRRNTIQDDFRVR